MPFTLSPMTHSEVGSPYPHWLIVRRADHIEIDEIIQTLTETFGQGGGKFPNLDSLWGHKDMWGEKVLMFRTLEDLVLARIRITC